MAAVSKVLFTGSLLATILEGIHFIRTRDNLLPVYVIIDVLLVMLVFQSMLMLIYYTNDSLYSSMLMASYCV